MALALLVAGLSVAAGLPEHFQQRNSQRNNPQPQWRPLNMEEAAILAYLTPYADDHRRGGLDVIVTRNCEVPVAQQPFAIFEIVSTKPFAGGGVEDHEYVAVNLNTGQVLDATVGNQIESKVLFGVAKIMRNAHQIDGKVIQEYGSMHPELRSGPPCGS
ncbi:MAG TPA: hypothetical protein VNF74_13545 [Terriglobales bacterium]|nr:hypothetical protein [Terriglobales bacterium]